MNLSFFFVLNPTSNTQTLNDEQTNWIKNVNAKVFQVRLFDFI